MQQCSGQWAQHRVYYLIRCHIQLENLRQRQVALLVACKRDEAACSEQVELVEWTDVHDQRVYAQVYAVHVRDGDRVVCEGPGHVLGHQFVKVRLVVEVVGL